MSSPALANYVSGSPVSFGSFPPSPESVAVDQVSQDVFVPDDDGTVFKFNEKGEPADFSGLGSSELSAGGVPYQAAVDNATGDLYVSNLADDLVEKFDASGVRDPVDPTIGGIVEPTGVAVDSSGDLFVADFHNAEAGQGGVYEFSSSGVPLNAGGPVITGLTRANSLALNTNGDLYVAEGGTGVFEYESNGLGGFDDIPKMIGSSTSTSSVTVDESTNDVFVGSEPSIEEFSKAGVPIGEAFGTGILAGSNAVAIDEATKEVYAQGGSGEAIAIFVPHPLSAKTDPATETTKTTTKLHAKVALEEGGEVEYHFEYGPTTSYGTKTTPAKVTVTKAADEAEVTAEVTGLKVGETYHYEVVATDATPGESAAGRDETVHTLGPPVIVGESVSAIGATGVSLEARIDPNSQETKYQFEYSTKATGEVLEGTIVEVPSTPGTLPAAFNPAGEPVSVPTGAVLQPGTTYYYRVTAENEAFEKEAGTVESFTTAPEAPETLGATGETATTAVLHGVLNPKVAASTGWYFAYKPESKAPCTGGETTIHEPEAKVQAQAESREVTGLEPSKRYVFCLVATDAAGAQSTAGSEASVETKALPPEVLGESAAPVGMTGATLNAQVNPNNLETTYAVEYSRTEAAGVLTGIVETVNGTAAIPPEVFGPQTVSVETGTVLAADTTYYYRLTAVNSKGVKAIPGVVEHFTTLPETPETLPASSVLATTATLNGVLSPKATTAGEPGSYEYLYKASASECEGAQRAPVPAGVAMGGKEAVPVNLTALQSDTTYTYCLLERNTANATVSGAALSFTTRGAGISEETVSGVEATAATLNAQINPNQSKTTWHFEYDTTPYTSSAQHGTSLPSPEGEIPAGTSPVPVTTQLQGLEPASTYYYRVVATTVLSPTETETVDGPNKTFTTNTPPSTTAETCPNAKARTEQPYGQALPDCRAYEMVSPLDKDGNDVSYDLGRASVSGEALTYMSRGLFDEPQGGAQTDRYIARREADGWSTQNITPLQSITQDQLFSPFDELLFTPELSAGIVRSSNVPLVQGEATGYINFYVADLASSPVSYQTVTVDQPGQERYMAGGGSHPVIAGASTDLSHVVFQSPLNWTAGATGIEEHIYEWVTGKLYQVDVSPARTQFDLEDNVGAPGRALEFGDAWHAVSADGRRVFFTAGQPNTLGGTEGSEGQLYVRENPEQEQSPEQNGQCTVPADACTIEVSKSQKTNGTGPDGTDPNSHGHGSAEGWAVEPEGLTRPAFYRDASANGERVFFTSRAELTNDADTGAADDAANLYEYNLQTKGLTDITVPTPAQAKEDPDGAAVLNLVTAGEEGSYVYFVANGVLASGENTNKETAQPGDCKKNEKKEEFTGEHTCSLYVAHYDSETGKWEAPKFIATLAGDDGADNVGLRDESDWAGYEWQGFSDWGPAHHTVQVTPDGTTLAFESERSLTGYDNEQAEPGECERNASEAEETGRCREVYLYDAATGRLVCASCDPSGARPVGPAELRQKGQQALLPPSLFYFPRNLSEDGDRLFFQSPDPLVPHDSNGKLDVYEWEAAGEGTCNRPLGCTFPISDVAGDYASYFMDASANGSDVFIATGDQLVPSDTDTREDVYDVRVGGGFSAESSPPPCNDGDSCKPPVSAQPSIFGPAGSATFSGPGNPAAPAAVAPLPPPKKVTKKTVKCKKAFVKNKKGRCVKKKRTKAKKSAHTNRRAGR